LDASTIIPSTPFFFVQKNAGDNPQSVLFGKGSSARRHTVTTEIHNHAAGRGHKR